MIFGRVLGGSGGLLAFLLLSGLASSLPPASAQATVAVSIPSGAGLGASSAPGFSPANVTVVIGVNNTVTWTNNDSGVLHTVYSTSVPAGTGAFNSSIMATGASFTHTFTVPGTYEYRCNLHPLWMMGSVIVKAATTTTPTPEFPVAYLAAILFAVIAAVSVTLRRLRPASPSTPRDGAARPSGPSSP